MLVDNTVSFITKGNIGRINLITGPLQMICLMTLINIPKMPSKLGVLFKNIQVLSFKFMPNIITILFPERITQKVF